MIVADGCRVIFSEYVPAGMSFSSKREVVVIIVLTDFTSFPAALKSVTLTAAPASPVKSMWSLAFPVASSVKRNQSSSAPPNDTSVTSPSPATLGSTYAAAGE